MAGLSEFKKTWSEGFMNYAADMAKFYQANKEGMISCLKFKSVTDSLNETYQVLVKEKNMVPIENLDDKKKNELWEKAKTIAEGKNQCIAICKAIYLLEKITS